MRTYLKSVGLGQKDVMLEWTEFIYMRIFN